VDRINILYIIWSLGLGGAERVVINLAKGLDRNKYNPMVCCLNDKGVFADELEREGIEVIALNKMGKFDFSILYRLFSILKDNRIQIIHTHLWGANFWGRIAGVIARVPVIIASEHGIQEYRTRFHYFADKVLSVFTDRVTFVCKSVEEQYASRLMFDTKKAEVIHNGVDTSTDCRQRAKTDETVFTVIGRLEPEKGHEYFLEAMEKLNGKHPNVKGMIVGEGSLEDGLRLKAKKLKLGDKVRFTGFRKDIKEILDITDVLVLPSLREGLSVVALEAMALGIPVLATEVGGNPELIRNGVTGVLVSPRDSTALASALTGILENQGLAPKLGENGYNRVKKHFSLENMVKKTQELYGECIERRNRQ